VGKKIIMCSHCNEEFENGYDYRMHWEEKHFYPYIGPASFDYERAKKDLKRNYAKKNLCRNREED
jgi:hypothetical protein